MHKLKALRGTKPTNFDEWDLYADYSEEEESDTELDSNEYTMDSYFDESYQSYSKIENESNSDDECPIHYGYMMIRLDITNPKKLQDFIGILFKIVLVNGIELLPMIMPQKCLKLT